MQKKLLTDYEADAGSCTINGIGINNSVGDGNFDVFYTAEPNDSLKEHIIDELWIDLRLGYGVNIHTYDCAKKDDPMFPVKHFEKEMFDGAEALQIAVDKGDIYLVKYF